MSDIMAATMGIQLCTSTASPEDLLPQSDCSNVGTSVSDTGSPARSEDKISVENENENEEDTSSLPGHTNGLQLNEDQHLSSSDDNLIDEQQNVHLLQIKGLPRFYRLGELKKLLTEELGLRNCSVRSPRRASPWIHICFNNVEDQQLALKTLNGYDWKKRHLIAEVVKADPLKRKTDSELDEDGEMKKLKVDMPVDDRIKMATIPYYDKPYDEQLEKKREEMEAALEKLAASLTRSYPELSGWTEQQTQAHKGMACELSAIRPSPVIDGYRNKCEFRIGTHPETKERTVGFRLASFKEGSMGVGPIYSLRHLPDRMKEVVRAFEQYVRLSPLSPFVPETHEGHWRQVTVRVSSRGDVLLLAVIHPQKLSEAELEAVKTDLTDYFQNGAGRECQLSALFFQTFVEKQEGVSPPPVQHLMGQKYLQETLMGLEFRISADAYFQVNTAGAQELYAAVAELANCNSELTTLLDICCSAGGIGLSMAKQCKHVIGIECVSQGIEDAKYNAATNGIENCEFHCGRAEDVLGTINEQLKESEVVAVVDPPRGGLHKKIVNELRKMEQVKRLVYVSTNPKIVIKNFADLCRPNGKDGKGTVFLPVKAIPVDIFPHTTHCQLVVCFERIDLSSLPARKKLPPLIKNIESFRGSKNRGKTVQRGNYRGNPAVVAYQRGLMDLKVCPPGSIFDKGGLRMPHMPTTQDFYPLVPPFHYPELILPRTPPRGLPPTRRLFHPALTPHLQRQQLPYVPMALDPLLLRQQQQFLEFPLAPRTLTLRTRCATNLRRGFKN